VHDVEDLYQFKINQWKDELKNLSALN
jgi:hypothetical protein